METWNEQELVQRILDGETQAFSILLRRFQRPIHALIRQMVSSKEDAEDLTQEVFVKAYRKLDTFRGKSSLSTWLYRIAYNTAVSETRKRRFVYPEFDEETMSRLPDLSVDALLEKEEDEALLVRLEAAVDRLCPEDKALITLFYKEDRPIAEIAQILDLSPENAKVKLHRTRKKLILLLHKHDDENR